MARKHGFGRFPRYVVALGVALSAILPVSLLAQSGSVSGTVRDQVTGLPLASVQISIPGTTLGAITSAAGTFRVDNVPVGTIELRVARLGYSPVSRTVQVVAGQVADETIDLAVSAVSLDALVATATGLQRRREIGNALATVQVSREMRRIAPTTVVSLLQGRAPGVTILQGSGSVGTSSSIKVRGNTSINLSNTPLVYIDGARVSNATASGPSVGGQSTSRLNDLDAHEIESIEVVKGPSAATLYGTEAAAGVLRITTRRGRTGATEWSFFSEMGSNWDDTAWPDNVFNPRSLFGTAASDTLYRMNLLEQIGTDLTPWRTGAERAFGGSMRGGMDQVTYFLSGSWDRKEGNLPNNESSRRNVRANFNLAPSPNVDIAVSTSFGSHDVTLPDNDNNVYGYLGVALVAFPWELPIRRDDPVTGEEDVRTCPIDYEFARLSGSPLGSIGCAANPFFSERTFEDVATLENRQHVERFTGSATLEYRPLSFLSARGTVGYDQYSDQTGSFIPVDPELPFDEDSRGIRSIDNAVIRHLTLQGDVSATFDLTPDVRSTTSVGLQYYRQKVESAGAVGRFLPTGSKLVSSAVMTEGGEGVGETRNAGVYLEQQIGWRDRLFVTPAVRVDDNAAFGENLGRKVYPRVMASWVVSEEAWFEGTMPGSFVESLRLRGAWGKSGKHPSSTAALTILGSQRVTFRGNDEAGITICCPGNPDLKPETGQETELGFEADLLDGRLGLDFTWFKKVAVDAIVSRGLAPSTGYPTSVATNIGEIENSGVELSLFAVAMDQGWVFWDWQVNLATVKGEITQLDEPIIYGVNGDSQRHEQGYPYGAYFSRDYFIGEDGEVDSTEEPVYQGHTTPEWDGSVSTSVTLLERITLYANLGFAGGHQLFNSTEEFRCGFLGGGTYGGICAQLYEKDAEGERTDEARLKGAAGEDVQYSPWIEDADFARLRTVSLRFDVPEAWIQRFGAIGASFMLAAENMALWTPYTGIDPEINSDGASQSTRLDFLTVPPPKRFTGRLEITF